MPELDTSASDTADTALLLESVRAAGNLARKYFKGSYASWDKSHGNPVTEADIAIDRNLHQVLLAARPDYGWLSEESEDDPARLSCTRVFVVDPIDGTIGFMRGRPQFTIVAAVVSAGRPLAAVIYNPITEEMYDATYRAGARRNGAPIQANNPDSFEGASILAPRDSLAPVRWRQPWPENMRIENRSSIAYRLALVADGSFDAMMSLSAKYDWDLAAGDLLLHEAKGCLTTLDGDTLLYNKAKPIQHGVISAGPVLHAQLLERCKTVRM